MKSQLVSGVVLLQEQSSRQDSLGALAEPRTERPPLREHAAGDAPGGHHNGPLTAPPHLQLHVPVAPLRISEQQNRPLHPRILQFHEVAL